MQRKDEMDAVTEAVTKTPTRGGRGYMLLVAEAGISTSPHASRLAASLPDLSCQHLPPAIQPDSIQILPTGLLPEANKRRLEQLALLYVELNHVLQAIAWLGYHLPALKLNDELKQRKAAIQAEIATLTEAACSSEPSPAKR